MLKIQFSLGTKIPISLLGVCGKGMSIMSESSNCLNQYILNLKMSLLIDRLFLGTPKVNSDMGYFKHNAKVLDEQFIKRIWFPILNAFLRAFDWRTLLQAVHLQILIRLMRLLSWIGLLRFLFLCLLLSSLDQQICNYQDSHDQLVHLTI